MQRLVHRIEKLLTCLGTLLLVVPTSTPSFGTTLDLTRTVIIDEGRDSITSKAALMLQEELAKRSGIILPIIKKASSHDLVIRIGTTTSTGDKQVPDAKEAYRISIDGNSINLLGRDPRGAMFAVGHLIRLADYSEGKISLTLTKPIATMPDVPFRVHQLAYRNTANTYDAWTIEMYEQYIRELIFFGCNGIEIIPCLEPDKKDGPVMKETMRTMNRKLATLIHSYGLDVWLWSPVMADGCEDITNSEGTKLAWEKRQAMFASYPYIDHLFVPGGDDGDAPAEHLMPFLKGLFPLLKTLHPQAKLWVSNQTFTTAENNYFFDYLQQDDLDWLTGVVYGPWTKIGHQEMRARIPNRIQIRRYPDINHTVRCQYPVKDWDPVFANTVGREPMMPQPSAQRHIYLRYRPITNGFGTYSDGIHDDLNKQMWNVLGWDPRTDPNVFLEEYGKLWWGPALAQDVALGLQMLEENWQGPILENETITKSLVLWENVSTHCHDFDSNWRAQMYLLRARYDAFVQKKAQAEQQYEKQALSALAKASVVGVPQAIANATALLAQADTPSTPGLLESIKQLGPMLLKSIGYQLSVRGPYFARNPERGAMLDWLDQPVNDRLWLEQRFQHILLLDDHAAQLKALKEIIDWTKPGPEGFYDNLGTIGQFAHVVYPQTWHQDPSGLHSPRVAFPYYKADHATFQLSQETFQSANISFEKKPNSIANSHRQELRMSWQSQIATHFGDPLRMLYHGLDPTAQYRLKVTYAGRYHPTMSLIANGGYLIHGPLKQPVPILPVEFRIPRAATQNGTLELEWNLVEGRGCMVSEVWLMKD
ncbi:MAG: glycoside hydrolase family 20 zincin-like fold domain-containing protein [Pirellulales bacterium]